MSNSNINIKTIPDLHRSDNDDAVDDGVGDIEQGIRSSSWAAAAVAGGTSTNSSSTTRLQGGHENVDVGGATPVPLTQQISDMEPKKDDVASTEDEDASKPSQSPTPSAPMMEQIEDGDDTAPGPFNSAKLLENESKQKIDLEDVSTHEDDEPPLPLHYQRYSVTDTMPTPSAPMMEQTEGEENLQQRFVGHGHIFASGDGDTHQDTLVSERRPSLPILEAYLVEVEVEGVDDAPLQADVATVPVVAPGGQIPVYEATSVESELPWWKQRRIKVLLMIIFVLIAALAAVFGYTFLRPATPNNSPPISTSTFPTAAPDISYACFSDGDMLKSTIGQYVQDGCSVRINVCPAEIVDRYGWPIGSWCVDDVTSMANLFEGLDTFDEDISGWNVGQVTDMRSMFSEASSFNGDISSWNTAAVTSMWSMFLGASSFNGDMSSWNTAAVTNMRYIFSGASSFNGDISSWNTAAVTDMQDMFYGASSFNGDISSWNTAAVTSMWSMFRDASSFNGDISSWNTAAVTFMNGMFYGASSFNGDISSWNTAAVTFMNGMFYGASSFNGDISSWNTAAVNDMQDMFNGASSFNGDISSWNTAAVTDMSRMFNGASSFNGDISSWNTAAVTYMYSMFNGASSFNQDLCAWKDINRFPYSRAASIFVDSGCTFQGDPQIEHGGPFCASSCTNS